MAMDSVKKYEGFWELLFACFMSVFCSAAMAVNIWAAINVAPFLWAFAVWGSGITIYSFLQMHDQIYLYRLWRQGN